MTISSPFRSGWWSGSIVPTHAPVLVCVSSKSVLGSIPRPSLDSRWSRSHARILTPPSSASTSLIPPYPRTSRARLDCHWVDSMHCVCCIDWCNMAVWQQESERRRQWWRHMLREQELHRGRTAPIDVWQQYERRYGPGSFHWKKFSRVWHGVMMMPRRVVMVSVMSMMLMIVTTSNFCLFLARPFHSHFSFARVYLNCFSPNCSKRFFLFSKSNLMCHVHPVFAPVFSAFVPDASASSAFEPGEEETLDSLILSASYSAAPRRSLPVAGVEMESAGSRCRRRGRVSAGFAPQERKMLNL